MLVMSHSPSIQYSGHQHLYIDVLYTKGALIYGNLITKFRRVLLKAVTSDPPPNERAQNL